jgi:hypothetical protein
MEIGSLYNTNAATKEKIGSFHWIKRQPVLSFSAKQMKFTLKWPFF